MSRENLTFLISSSLWRYAGKSDGKTLIQALVAYPGFSFIFWLRLVKWLRHQDSILCLLAPPAALVKRHLSFKYGISIPSNTDIGPGFYIGHHGGIVINPAVVIGRDCNISQGVTIGKANRGQRAGVPRLGDRVYVGPGAKIVGAVVVGSDVAIGANAVVTEDVVDGSVVGGVPARLLSNDGSAGYIGRTDYHGHA